MRAGPKRPAWNRIPDNVRGDILGTALQKPELSPRELAITFTHEKNYFVSEASVYRILKAHNLILDIVEGNHDDRCNNYQSSLSVLLSLFLITPLSPPYCHEAGP
jgi:hypothetical protein